MTEAEITTEICALLGPHNKECIVLKATTDIPAELNIDSVGVLDLVRQRSPVGVQAAVSLDHPAMILFDGGSLLECGDARLPPQRVGRALADLAVVPAVRRQ